MSEWNERIENAKKAALTCFPGAPFVRDMLVAFADALKEPDKPNEVRLNQMCDECGCDESGAPWHIKVLDAKALATRIICDVCHKKEKAEAEEYSADLGRQLMKEALTTSVRNSEGKIWWIDNETGNVVPFNEPVDVAKARKMTDAEAFRPGAFVERKYCEGEKYSGTIATKLDKRGKVLVRCGPDYFPRREMDVSELSLVKPAPEGML